MVGTLWTVPHAGIDFTEIKPRKSWDIVDDDKVWSAAKLNTLLDFSLTITIMDTLWTGTGMGS